MVFSALELGNLMLGRRMAYWKRYEREFDGYINTAKTIGWLAMITMLVIAGAAAIWLMVAAKALPR